MELCVISVFSVVNKNLGGVENRLSAFVPLWLVKKSHAFAPQIGKKQRTTSS
jgi:hypothetical protein